jgi:hypothetical protein
MNTRRDYWIDCFQSSQNPAIESMAAQSLDNKSTGDQLNVSAYSWDAVWERYWLPVLKEMAARLHPETSCLPKGMNSEGM